MERLVMGISIKNAHVEAMIRELAARRNLSMTEILEQILENEMLKEQVLIEEKINELMAIGKYSAQLPAISTMTDDEILGYDEHGVASL
jgi:antitoxin VapB